MHHVRQDLLDAAKKLSAGVVAEHASDVDVKARFPSEAFAALKSAKLLSMWVPKDFGGGGASLSDVCAVTRTLASGCASTGMIFAMHQIQVACLFRHHGGSAFVMRYLEELSEKELLLASATSEAGIGGSIRTSSCAVEAKGKTFTLKKNATVVSYCEAADAILVTARKNPDAPPNEQVLVIAPKAACKLERTSVWDTLGMRGTISDGFIVATEGSTDQVLPVPYGDISAQTMLPTAHTTWGNVWLGIATDAVNRARAFVRQEARKTPGTTPPGALRMAEAMNQLQLMRANVEDCMQQYDEAAGKPDALTSLSFAIRMNNLKVGSSEMALKVVDHALLVCGINGYRNDSKFSLGRHLRDAHSARLMVSNDRILGNVANMLLVSKDE